MSIFSSWSAAKDVDLFKWMILVPLQGTLSSVTRLRGSTQSEPKCITAGAEGKLTGASVGFPNFKDQIPVLEIRIVQLIQNNLSDLMHCPYASLKAFF